MFCCCDLELYLMTSIYEYNLDIPKMCLHTKKEVSGLIKAFGSKSTNRTDRHAYRQMRTNALPSAFVGGNSKHSERVYTSAKPRRTDVVGRAKNARLENAGPLLQDGKCFPVSRFPDLHVRLSAFSSLVFLSPHIFTQQMSI